MPDVLVQKCAEGGAMDSTCFQRDCLKATSSGPCSWTMVADAQAVSSELWIWRRPEDISDVTSDSGSTESDLDASDIKWWPKKIGKVLRKYCSKSGRVSNTSTAVFSRARWRAAIDMPMVPSPIKAIR